MTKEVAKQDDSLTLVGFSSKRVKILLAILHLEAGDVVEVPEKLAELWGFGRIAFVVDDDTPTTAVLSNHDLTKISQGLDIS
ncbi:hypothetical protein JNUCC0626_18435 [Lentzea sp. JNUCC 0626]|uniref:hypothetical protein n=1 Tax=Lentzea sp. JNUCC 0626 TaxID=3367513 RepID=UPI00374938E9